MRKLTSTVFVFGAACLVALSGCGGGGGGGGSTPVASTSTVSSGTVTGFGSVFVNGVKYSTAGATVHRPDDSITKTLGSEAEIQEHLRIGMQVRVKGSSNGISGSALEIEFKDNLEGKVTAKTADSLTVLGITVKVNSSTKFDKSDTDTTMAAFMASIVPGTSWVEVSGVPDNTGTLIATFIEDKVPDTEQELKGYIVASTASSFDLGLTAGIKSVTINAVLPAGIAIGSYVEVKYDAAGTFFKVEIEDDLVKGDNAVKAEAEGYVSAIGANDMTVLVNGSPKSVVLAAGTVYFFKLDNGVLQPATKADLKVGQKVSAEGPISSAGVITAEKVKIRIN